MEVEVGVGLTFKGLPSMCLKQKNVLKYICNTNGKEEIKCIKTDDEHIQNLVFLFFQLEI